MSNNKTLVIGIAGGSACGKSTLCEMLANEFTSFKVQTMHMDDYYCTVRPKMISPITRAEYDDYNHPNCIDFKRLLADLEQFKTSDEPIDVIIIEGFLALYHDDLRSHHDLKVFIDVPSDERLARRIKRNLEWGLTFDEIADYYLDAVRYRHDEFVEPSRWHADIVLNGSNFSKTALQMITEWVKIRTK